MSEFILTRSGAELVESLTHDCGFGSEAARRFVELRTREPFEAERLYSVGYTAGEEGLDWTRFRTLRVWKRPPGDARSSEDSDRFHPGEMAGSK